MAKRPHKTKQTAKGKASKTFAEAALKCNTAHELITLIHSTLGDEEYVFRGVPKKYQKSDDDNTYINSSIYRRYGEIGFSGNYQPVHIESEIVDDAKTYFLPHTSNIEKLSDIRHFGGDTTLIDFSKDVLVALFFACQTDLTEDTEENTEEADGQLIILPIKATRPIIDIKYLEEFGIKPISEQDANKIVYQNNEYDFENVSKVKKHEGADERDIWEENFKSLRRIDPVKTATNQARVVAQKSIFIHAPIGYINPEKCLIIPIKTELKPDILKYLDRFHDINQRTIYNDLHGLIEAQEHSLQARLSFFEGNKHFLEGDFEGAVHFFGNAIQLKPDYTESYFLRGSAKFTLGQYEDAIKDFNHGIKLNPDDAMAYCGRGIAKSALKQYQDAMTDHDKAIQLKPDDAEAYFYRGGTKYKLGQYPDAITDFDKAIRLKPDDADAYFLRGIVKGILEDYEDAIADYDQSITLNLEYADAYYIRGVYKNNLGEYENAIVDFNEAIQLKPDYAEAYCNCGVAKGNLGQHQDAITDFDQAIRLNPDFAEAYSHRGGAKGILEDYEDAIADYNQAIQLKPDFSKAYLNRGIAKGILKDHEDAIADYDQAIQLKPDFARAYFYRGVAKGNLGQHKDAITDYDQAIQLNPDFADAYFLRGFMHQALGKTKDAKADFAKAEELGYIPPDPKNDDTPT